MKRIILTVLILFLSLPCFAGNLLQQEYETKKAVKIASEPVFYNITKNRLLENDYMAYINGGGSMYGVWLKAKEDMEKSTIPNKTINLKYLSLIIDKYTITVKSLNRNLTPLQKIIIDDEDYGKLNNDVREFVSVYNFLAN